jgi:hypothetical protein
VVAVHERRRGHGSQIRIPADALRSGESVPFAVRYDPMLVRETFRNGFIDHDAYIVVEAHIPWASDPAFELPIQILPAGSRNRLRPPHLTELPGSAYQPDATRM